MVTTVRPGNVQRLIPTGPFEENAKVARIVADLAKRANEGGASSIMFLPQKGVKFDAFAFAYHTGLAKELNIPKTPNGPLRGTVIINISGHASGSVSDRVIGWAERQFSREGVKVTDSAAAYQELRKAGEAAAREFQSDYQKTKQSVDITFEGKSIKLSRDMFDKMQKASLDSDDNELSKLAQWGNDALRKHFGCTNSYQVRIQTPDGKSDVQTFQRNNPDKIELATRIAVELPPGEGTYILEAWPNGSAGVAGYTEARRYKIHVGKEQFDLDKAVEAAEKYQQAHPEIRWDTEHEDEDLEAKHVSPSPYPYQDF